MLMKFSENPFAQGAIRGGIEEIDRVFNTTVASSEFDTELALADPEILRIKSEHDAQFNQALNQSLEELHSCLKVVIL